jgi:hypothetical protein
VEDTVKDTKRALRRHQVARRRVRVAREFYWQIAFQRGRRRTKFIDMLAETPKLCSCFMCGNPRRYFGEPRPRELRADRPLAIADAEWPERGGLARMAMGMGPRSTLPGRRQQTVPDLLRLDDEEGSGQSRCARRRRSPLA